MILSICTISFRHQLVSIDQLAQWAKEHHFQGIELWGAHAKNLASQPHYNKQWLAEYDLKTTMLSDYLNLDAKEPDLRSQVDTLCHLATHWGTKKLRTFAGTKGSLALSSKEFATLTNTLKKVCTWLAQHEISLIIETHPNTYADCVPAIKKLIAAVDCDNLKINFDVLHVWESKIDVIPAFEQLKPHINHFHLKNISSAEFLDVFAPATVYSAAGSREGIVPLFEGAVDYKAFLEHVYHHPDPRIRNMEASLEWFGENNTETLDRDRYLIRQLQQHASPFTV